MIGEKEVVPVATVISTVSWVLVSGACRLHQGFLHGRLVLLRRPCLRHPEVVHRPAGLRFHVLTHVLCLPCLFSFAPACSLPLPCQPWWSSLDSDRDGCRGSVHRYGCSPGSSPAWLLRLPAASSVLPHLSHGLVIELLSFFVQVQAQHRPTVPPGRCRVPGIREATLASFLWVGLRLWVDRRLSVQDPCLTYSPVVALLGLSQLAGLTVIEKDPKCTERSFFSVLLLFSVSESLSPRWHQVQFA